MEFSVLLEKMLIFIVLMLIGYVLARRGTLGPEFTRTASKLVIDVFLTGTILNSIIKTGNERSLSNLGIIILMTFVVQILAYVVAAIAMRFVSVEENRAAPMELLIAVPNTMFIALPIAESIYGSYAVLILSVSCIAFNSLLYSYGIWKMKGGSFATLRVKDVLSVPLIATLAGILILLLRIPVPAVLMNLFAALNGATMPLSMMVIGASLGSVSLLEAFRSPKLALVSLLRLLVIPVLAWLVCRLFTNDTVLLMTCMLIAAAPSAVMITIVSIQFGRDGVFSSEGVLHTTVCSMLTIPFLIAILSRFC
jgi:hypothetical protein